MALILINDDGVDAPGLAALQKAVGGECLVVAPQAHLSGCGHQVTTTQPIQVERRSEKVFAIAGTPVDCTRIALTHLCPQVEWVLSGINAGGNLGVDAYISGTVAAVREAAMHRIPGVAISQYRKGKRPVDWQRAADWAASVLSKLFTLPLEPSSFWNVNLPHLEPSDPDPEIVFCQPGTRPLPAQFRVEGDQFFYAGKYQERERDPGTDVAVCFSDRIAITQIHL